MPIEFSCSQCKAILRTADDTAGKAARCPQCGNFENIPFPDQDSASGELPPSRESEPEFHEPVKPAPERPAENPYAVQPSPYAQATPDEPNWNIGPPARPAIRSRLMPPAITVLVLSCVTILVVGISSVGGVIAVLENGLAEDVIALILCGGVILCNGVAVAGSITMLQMRNHGLCVLGMICAILGSACCWFLTSGFAIWGLVVLMQPDVKDSFQ